MSVTLSTRQQAIEALHEFFLCPYDLKIQQPWALRETEHRSEYEFLCGHRSAKPINIENQPITAGHPMEVFLTAETDGYRYTAWGRSFLTAYYAMQAYLQSKQQSVANANTVLPTITDTGGTSRTAVNAASPAGAQNFWGTQDVSADNSYGIQAGTGTTANSVSTSALATLIANGSAATQLNYGAMAITPPSGFAPVSYTFARTLTNNSGSSITINEAGLAFGSYWETNNTSRFFLAIRDVNAGGIVTIANTSNSTLTYTLSSN